MSRAVQRDAGPKVCGGTRATVTAACHQPSCVGDASARYDRQERKERSTVRRTFFSGRLLIYGELGHQRIGGSVPPRSVGYPGVARLTPAGQDGSNSPL